MQYLSEPVWPELLPPPFPPPHQKPYTLVVSIDDLLVTSTWDVSICTFRMRPCVLTPLQRQHGWRTAKRPGVDYFLAYVSQFYEVVIFTSQHSYVSGSDDEMLSRANVCLDCRAYSR